MEQQEKDQQERPGAQIPRTVEPLLNEPELAAAWQHQVTARRAEAAKITALLDYQKRVTDYYTSAHGVPYDYLIRSTAREAGLLLGVSDMTAGIILEAAGFARRLLPATWEAFGDGLIDLIRLRKIVQACCELDDSVARIVDAAAAPEAAARSAADFAHWLTRYIAYTDFEAYLRLSRSTRRQRHVRFEHLSNGMSFISAFLPTLEAAAIEKRLKITARRQHGAPKAEPAHLQEPTGATPSPDQLDLQRQQDQQKTLTLAEREADLFSAWLRTNPTDEPAPVEAKIMVMIPEATLIGHSNEPGLSADRSWALPGDQARRLAGDPRASHHWYQGRTRLRAGDADVDVLSVTYAGRCPPQRLRDALIFRDGRCRVPGCAVPAERCDIDHHTPYEAGGPTGPNNLWVLCRRHHRLKSRGLLLPLSTESPAGTDPPERDHKPPGGLGRVDLCRALGTIRLAA